MITNWGKHGLTFRTVTNQQNSAINLLITPGSLTSQTRECYTDVNLDLTSNHKVCIITIEIIGIQ